ncbi:MAG: ABC transporter ATP-binding protein [Evtepia sp.]
MKEEPILEVTDLRTSFFTPLGERQAVNGISYTLGRGEIMGIVGESGSGKSVQAYSILGLLPNAGRVVGGSIRFEGEELLKTSPERLRKLRGKQIAMVFQNPFGSLNPVCTIGTQLIEAYRTHNKKRDGRKQAIALLEQVGVNDASRRMRQYPHELSGGMCQRVMIAMALICDPQVLIADEPTTALDVTVQAEILDLLRRLQEERNLSVLMISHNLNVVAELCDRIAVMYGGRIMEQGRSVFQNPRHPYTQGLLRSIPVEDQKLTPIPGNPADHNTRGCPFAPRCTEAIAKCHTKIPESVEIESDHFVACIKEKL